MMLLAEQVLRALEEIAEGLGRDERPHVEKHAGLQIVACRLEHAATTVQVQATTVLAKELLAAALKLPEVRAARPARHRYRLERRDKEAPLVHGCHAEAHCLA